MGSTTDVALAAIAFVGSHFLLSHPLRAPLVRAMGEGPFLGLYSAVSFATLIWLGLAYRAAPTEAPWWPVGDGLWAIATAVMIPTSVLLVGSLIGNPALPDPSGKAGAAAAPEPRGVFTITRHPMMWAFALWGACHILVYPVAANVIVAAAIIVLALVGAALQDRKKRALQPERWPAWQDKTSFWPLAAIIAGRTRFRPAEVVPILGGLALWLAATWAHLPLAGWPAGIWRWF